MRKLKDSGIEWIGDIPAEWRIAYPKQLFHPRKERARHDDVMLTASQHHGMIPQDAFMAKEAYTPVVVEKGHDILKHVEPGDFVISMRSFQGGLEYSRLRGKMSSAYLALASHSDEVDNEYFRWLFKSDRYIQALQSTTNLVRDGQALRFANFIQVYLPVPGLAEQRNIADYLTLKCEEIDKAIEAAEASIAEYESYKKSTIFQAVTKGLDPSVPMKDSGIEWVGAIPSHWRTIRVAELFSLRNETVSDEDYPPLSVTKKGVLPQLTHVAKSNDHSNRKLVKQGDFAINSRSDRRNSSGFAPSDGSVSLINIVLRPAKPFDARYYEMLFDTVQFGDEFYSYGHGIVADLWTTRWSEMKGIVVLEPSIEEQAQIADHLLEKCRSIDSAIESKKSIIEELKAYKKSLIYEVVTGKREI